MMLKGNEGAKIRLPVALDSVRSRALETYGILDAPPEFDFNSIAELAAFVVGAPTAMVAFVGPETMWVRGSSGNLDSFVAEEDSFLAYIVTMSSGVVVVEDALTDLRFSTNRNASEGPNLRFFAGVPIFTHDGFAIGALCVFGPEPRTLTDVQRKGLRNLANQASSLLELRRSALELERVRADALSAERSKSAFLANMSHEIRTPMNGVLGVVALLRQTELSDTQRVLLNTIEQSAESLMDLLSDVLDYSDHMAGRTTLVKRRISVHELVSQIDDLMRPVALQRNLRLVCLVSQSIDEDIVADPLRLKQVLLQLVDNAVKFTLEGTVELQVKKVGNMLRFSVRDTGVGIPSEMLQSILEPFNQSEERHDANLEGHGLGLPAVKELLRMMGSSLRIESELAGGSTFTFELPLSNGSVLGGARGAVSVS